MAWRIASPPVCRAPCRSSRLRGTEPRGTVSRAAPARSAYRAPPRGRLRRSALLRELSASAASEPLEELELVDAAAQVSAWCGEPLLYDGDDPAITLAPGTARRRALDAAREEIAQGLDAPSPAWRFRFSLMLGLERVLAADQPALAERPHAAPAPGRRARGHARRADRGRGARGRPRRPRGRGDDDDELNGDDPPIDELEADAEADEDDDEDDEDEDEDEDEEDDDEDEDERRRGGVEAEADEASRRGRRRGRGRRGARDPRSGRGAPLPLQASDRIGQDGRRRRLRRGLPHASACSSSRTAACSSTSSCATSRSRATARG